MRRKWCGALNAQTPQNTRHIWPSIGQNYLLFVADQKSIKSRCIADEPCRFMAQICRGLSESNAALSWLSRHVVRHDPRSFCRLTDVLPGEKPYSEIRTNAMPAVCASKISVCRLSPTISVRDLSTGPSSLNASSQILANGFPKNSGVSYV